MSLVFFLDIQDAYPHLGVFRTWHHPRRPWFSSPSWRLRAPYWAGWGCARGHRCNMAAGNYPLCWLLCHTKRGYAFTICFNGKLNEVLEPFPWMCCWHRLLMTSTCCSLAQTQSWRFQVTLLGWGSQVGRLQARTSTRFSMYLHVVNCQIALLCQNWLMELWSDPEPETVW